MNKEKAIEMIKDICNLNANLNLRINDGTALWSLNSVRMTPTDWKHVGYVSALAYVFDIKEVE